MRCARYVGNGQIEIVEEPDPILSEGGLLVKTEACGLCSGELMDWYMDRKIPHVLGHEVCGRVIASADHRFPVGCRVFPHHHAPCLRCDSCHSGLYVHCEQWKSTKLRPGGMATEFSVSAQNLTDCIRVDDLRPIDAALIEPVACVVKALRRVPPRGEIAVIGLGAMGLIHMALLGRFAVGFDLSPARIERAWKSGFRTVLVSATRDDSNTIKRFPEDLGAGVSEDLERGRYDTVYVCPGNPAALDLALQVARPGATISLFAPLGPLQDWSMPFDELYFRDISLVPSFSCGPDDTSEATRLIRAGKLKAELLVSDFITLDELPAAYQSMKSGEILKPMVVF